MKHNNEAENSHSPAGWFCFFPGTQTAIFIKTRSRFGILKFSLSLPAVNKKDVRVFIKRISHRLKLEAFLQVKLIKLGKIWEK